MIMSLYLSPHTILLRRKPYTTSEATMNDGTQRVKANDLQLESTKDRIRKLFDHTQMSISSYDTAWVALVPSPTSSENPCFPKCVDWLLSNQQNDGSWGNSSHHLLVKDSLSSTLASILALKRWDVGKEQIDRGLHFIESNIKSASDDKQHSPIGFEIIFPGLIKYAEDFNLRMPIEPSALDTMLRRRELELKRGYSKGRTSYLAYISEGIGKANNWNMVMECQRKNGSILNSPSATAATYMHLKDAQCLKYLRALVLKFGNAVPTTYPLDIYMRLCLVDNLERLGIRRHFSYEITSVLDDTYRCWLQGKEEIFLDNATCTIAFRLLRLNGYDVSSDHIMQIVEEELDINSTLELYRASEAILYPDELALEKKNSRCGQFLKQKLHTDEANVDKLDMHTRQEVNEAIEFPFYVMLDRVRNRNAIDHYDVDSAHVLKTSYHSPNIRNGDFLKLAIGDFNICQSIHQEELKSIERWVVENRLDDLKFFAKQKVVYCYFSSVATSFAPELSDARMSWTKNAILASVVDDFYDFAGSMDELENLINLLRTWDVDLSIDCCSEQVEILFNALRSTILEIGDKAFAYQGRDVTGHLIEIWVDLASAFFQETKWANDKYVPTLDTYMNNGYVSFALGPVVLPFLYFLGPKLSEEVVSSSEYHKLYKLMSTCGRLLNDIGGYERDSSQGYEMINALSLHMIDGNQEEAEKKIRSITTGLTRELLKMVLQKKGSIVPQACKDGFWKMCKVNHFSHLRDDWCNNTGHKKIAVKSLLYEPISR